MIFITTAGVYRIRQDDVEPSMLYVYSPDRESSQILVDGVEMVCGVHREILPLPLDPDHKFRVHLSRENFAEWVSFEIREYDI